LQNQHTFTCRFRGQSTPVPFAGNLYGSGGAGSSSNELRLIIVSHSASNKLCGYDQGELFDGVSGGKTYFTGDRDISLFAPNDNANYKFAFTSSPGGALLSLLSLLRGRCKIWASGQVAALEPRQNASGNAGVNGARAIIGASVDNAARRGARMILLHWAAKTIVLPPSATAVIHHAAKFAFCTPLQRVIFRLYVKIAVDLLFFFTC
jgi:hypothetical protein